MTTGLIYIFGEPGSGKTFLSDKFEKAFIANNGFDAIPIDDSNLVETISNLDQYENTILIVQSNLLERNHLKAFFKFIENDKYKRLVVIQSEFKPDTEFEDLCHVYETGYPYFEWVTYVGDGLWEAKASKSEKTRRAYEKNQACELVRDYKTGNSNIINREGV